MFAVLKLPVIFFLFLWKGLKQLLVSSIRWRLVSLAPVNATDPMIHVFSNEFPLDPIVKLFHSLVWPKCCYRVNKRPKLFKIFLFYCSVSVIQSSSKRIETQPKRVCVLGLQQKWYKEKTCPEYKYVPQFSDLLKKKKISLISHFKILRIHCGAGQQSREREKVHWS